MGISAQINIAVVVKATGRLTACLMVALGMGCGILSCKKTSPGNMSEDGILVEAGDSVLRISDVISKIPSGLSPEDSAAMFSNLVNEWVNGLVMTDVAAKNIPDMERIEKMVEDYRNNLIINSYLSAMSERYNRDVPELRIKEYYNTHLEEMVLEQPLVKGAYLQVSDGDPNIDKLRKWMEDFSRGSVDNIEKNLRQASKYVYFRNDWKAWNVIAEQIPYRFFDADAFLNSTRDFETSDRGNIYLLHISDVIPSGSQMPYEYARERIASILRAQDISNYKIRLIKDIYTQRIKEGWLKPGIYDPLSGTMKDLTSKEDIGEKSNMKAK